MRRQQQSKPMRRCIACYTSYPQNELQRFTLVDGEIVPDTDGKNDGRGFYLCKKRECLDVAIKKKAFNRICKKNVDPDTIRQVVEKVLDNTKEAQ
ncbi:MAG: YlxR family protein [Clostridiales bacterium]|nr:YlxR family protein [Candidatus Crickella equi]